MRQICQSLLNKPWLRFLFCGGINTAVTYGIYCLLQLFLHYQIAYAFAYGMGVVFSYWLNTVLVFKETLAWKKFFQYPVVYLAQYSLSALLMWVAVKYLNVNETLAPLVILIITIPMTYFLSKLIIVTKHKDINRINIS